MKALIAALLLTASAQAETLVFPVQDLLFEHVNFTNAPEFSLNQALNGTWVPENPAKQDRKTRKERERKLIDFMWEEFPDAKSIRIWQGNLIIRI